MANGVVEVIARRWQQTASGGILIHALLGVVVYYVTCFLRVANATMNRSTLLKQFKRDNVTENASIIACCVAPRVEFGNDTLTMDRSRLGF